jgi:hypothetical protein
MLSLIKWLEHKQTKVCNSKVISNKRLKIEKKKTNQAMNPKYKSKMLQKQRERARVNRAESKESNKPKTTSAERMRKLRERHKAETSGVVSEPGVASTSRAAQAMDIDTDSKQSTQSQTESTQYSTRSLCNSHN